MAALRSCTYSMYNKCFPAIPLVAICRCHNTAAKAQNHGDFLQGAKHRKHPGITFLKMVHLPEQLEKGAMSVIQGTGMRDVRDRAQRLCNYLWSRKTASEDSHLRERALAMEKSLREERGGADGDPRHMEARIRKEVLSTLKKNTYHWTPLKYDEELSVVYLAGRLAGGYAAVRRALNEINKRDAAFTPHSMLDFGSGLGSGLWAAHSLWGDSLQESVCVDTSKAMNMLAERLLRGGGDTDEPFLKQVYFRQFLPVSPQVQFDLVLGAFSLSELQSRRERREAVLTLWRKTNGYLVLLENGTKAGHQILMEARDAVLQGENKVTDTRKATVFAPCVHSLACPALAQETQRPCNFPQAYRPLALPGSTQREVELFSYLLLSRGMPEGGGGESQDWARLVGPVLRRPRHVHCQLCCVDGELRRVVVTASRQGRDVYRCARNSECGDRLPFVAQGEKETQSD